LVHNERTKLTATWFNTLATALVAAGVFAPAVALLYGSSQASVSPTYVVTLAVGCLVFGIGLQVVGRQLLGRLQE
jgi:Na+/melibiose symporter-like transporter